MSQCIKTSSLLFSLWLTFHGVNSHAQEIHHIRPNKVQKDSLKNQINTMLADDQKYRWMLMYGATDEQEIKAFKAMDDTAKWKRFQDVLDHKAGISVAKLDSIWKLQAAIDSANFLKVMAITKMFGFPHKYVESYKATAILCHAAEGYWNDDFFRTLKDEVLLGNIEPDVYAGLYDNIQWKMHRQELYFVNLQYHKTTKTSDHGTPPDLELTNKARAEIGLKKFRQKK